MNDSYTEGWPKKRIAAMNHLGTRRDDFEVVPLSDAERMERCLRVVKLYAQVADEGHPPASKLYEALQQIKADVDRALNPEDKS